MPPQSVRAVTFSWGDITRRIPPLMSVAGLALLAASIWRLRRRSTGGFVLWARNGDAHLCSFTGVLLDNLKTWAVFPNERYNDGDSLSCSLSPDGRRLLRLDATEFADNDALGTDQLTNVYRLLTLTNELFTGDVAWEMILPPLNGHDPVIPAEVFYMQQDDDEGEAEFGGAPSLWRVKWGGDGGDSSITQMWPSWIDSDRLLFSGVAHYVTSDQPNWENAQDKIVSCWAIVRLTGTDHVTEVFGFDSSKPPVLPTPLWPAPTLPLSLGYVMTPASGNGAAALEAGKQLLLSGMPVKLPPALGGGVVAVHGPYAS